MRGRGGGIRISAPKHLAAAQLLVSRIARRAVRRRRDRSCGRRMRGCLVEFIPVDTADMKMSWGCSAVTKLGALLVGWRVAGERLPTGVDVSSVGFAGHLGARLGA